MLSSGRNALLLTCHDVVLCKQNTNRFAVLQAALVTYDGTLQHTLVDTCTAHLTLCVCRCAKNVMWLLLCVSQGLKA